MITRTVTRKRSTRSKRMVYPRSSSRVSFFKKIEFKRIEFKKIEFKRTEFKRTEFKKIEFKQVLVKY